MAPLIRLPVTIRDPEAEHQIGLEYAWTQGRGLAVWCNCSDKPLGFISVHEDPWPVFDGAEHIGPFTPGQRTPKEIVRVLQ